MADGTKITYGMIFLIELSAEECLWRMVLQDPRYNNLFERRKDVRRKGDQSVNPGADFAFSGNFKFVERLLTDD